MRGGRESDCKLREREKEIEKERDWSWVSHGRQDWSSDGRLHVAQSRWDDLDDGISTVRLGLGHDLAHFLSLSVWVSVNPKIN